MQERPITQARSIGSRGGATLNASKTGVSAAAGTKEWTAAEKAKPRTLQISFSIHTMRGNYGTATVTTPDGKTHTVSTGMSLTHQRAMEDLSKQMKSTLSQVGWTNVTLENANFHWSD